MRKKFLLSTLIGSTLALGFFATNDETPSTAQAANYNFAFTTKNITVNLNKDYAVTGYQQYRGLNKVGITLGYKVTTSGLVINNANYYKSSIVWPVAVSNKSIKITQWSAKKGKSISAYALYNGSVKATNGVKLLTETPQATGYLKLVSIDSKKKTAKVQFTGSLKH